MPGLPPRKGPRPSRPSHRPQGVAPVVRRGAVRVPSEVAWRLRAGHPWVFREALGNRAPHEAAGALIDVLDDTGAFVGRGIFDPQGAVAIRLFSRTAGELLDRSSLEGRLREARHLREKLLPPDLTAHRVLHGEGDGVPGVVIDRYGEHFVVQLYTPAVEPLREALLDALTAVWKPRSVYEQKRQRPQTGEGPKPAEHVRGEVAPVEIEVSEGGLKFAVDVTAPLGTGLFPDLRAGRQLVSRLARGRRVLNLFSYTGAFSLHAAKGGATEVVSVDLASKAHGRARRNLVINGLDEKGHEFVVGDAHKVLARLSDRARRFDLVIIDPPSFAQLKNGVFVAHKEYRDLVAASLGVLAPGGLLCCASNTAKLPPDDFDRILGDGAFVAKRTLTTVERCGLPPDFPIPAGFPEGHYLKFSVLAARP